MHPDIINGSSDTAIIQPTSVIHNQTAQHGFPVSVSTEHPIRVDPQAVVGSGGVIDDAASGEGFPERTSRLNAPEGSSVEGLPRDDGGSEYPSKKDAIRKYEEMGVFPTTETAFRIKKTNWDGRRDSPISKFPNEILIHALSFLDPQTLLTAALISRRFYSLVTSPDAWRSAFSRYFPSIIFDKSSSDIYESPALSSSQDRRHFTRLSASDNGINSWRREYILRTRLLRSLSKGKASLATSASSPTNQNSHGSIIITYPAAAWSVSHITASFTPRGVRLLHASVHTPGVVSASDPTIGRIERPPIAEASLRTQERPDLHQPLLGLYGFEVATDMGTSGVMDLSEDIGWIYGENVPDGKVYIHPYTSPYIAASPPGLYIRPEHEKIDGFRPAVTALWIAKRRSGGVLETTQGRAGVVVGNSRGVVSIYGLSFGKENGLTRAKKFVVSPGIPIVSIKVDDDYSIKRMKQKNFWIAVVNALGEVYYLKDLVDIWKIIPQTARTTTVLCNSTFPMPIMSPTKDQQAEWGKERNERLMKMSYGEIKEIWEGWGMDWFIEVDWPDQSVVLGKKQSMERRPRPQDDVTESVLYRYHLAPRTSRSGAKSDFVHGLLVISPTEEIDASENSLFGGYVEDSAEKIINKIKMGSSSNSTADITDRWIATQLELGGKGFHIITATAMDNSNLALLSDREEPGTDADVPGGNARLFAVGTSMGSIFLWNIRSPVLPDVAGVGVYGPLRVIHTDSPQIASLALSSLYLVHGGTDGLVQAWDPLGSTLSRIRDIHSRFTLRARRRLAQADAGVQDEFGIGDNQFAARCIILDPDATSLRGAVALGTHIRYWSFSSPAVEGERKRRKQGTRSRAGGAPSRGNGAIKAVIESETKHLLRQKERERKEKEDLKNRYGIASGRAALSEEEMVEYATMISRETFERENGSAPIGLGESVTSSRTVTPDAVSSYSTADEYKTPTEDGHEDVDMDLAEALRLSLLENNPEDGGSSKPKDGVWEDADYLYSDFGSSTNRSTSHYSPYPYSGASSSSSRPENSNSTRLHSSLMSTSKSRGWERLPLDKIDGRPIVGKGKGKYQSNDKEEEDFENEIEMAIRLSLMEEEERKEIMEALAEDDDNDFGKGKGKGKA
ncbi:uncharacterized protein LAJ45_06269 [Morchella importuna]|uniref:uncharacterized protein n=1 Tax=Morchella importuna TaxID=1174673 RepID=UPI001E8E8AE2|nr:uncharacterized protein LAJ45_06269 [Morchella importuna]KAH8149638.1 hypothetical protein LAJ45_06269 [Morchella importuna]